MHEDNKQHSVRRPTLAVIEVDELELLIGRAVERALAAHGVGRATQTRARDRLTVDEAARELGCCSRKVRSLIAEKRLRAEKLATGRGSSRVFIRRGDIDRLLDESRV